MTGQTEQSAVSIDELRELCNLTVKLTELRQKECTHLCIENYAPDLLHKLLTRLVVFKAGIVCAGDQDMYELEKDLPDIMRTLARKSLFQGDE